MTGLCITLGLDVIMSGIFGVELKRRLSAAEGGSGENVNCDWLLEAPGNIKLAALSGLSAVICEH